MTQNLQSQQRKRNHWITKRNLSQNKLQSWMLKVKLLIQQNINIHGPLFIVKRPAARKKSSISDKAQIRKQSSDKKEGRKSSGYDK